LSITADGIEYIERIDCDNVPWTQFTYRAYRLTENINVQPELK
jgi:hypothetical protein